MPTTRWTFVIQQDASRFRSWRDVEPHVRHGFPKLFATDALDAEIRTDARPGLPPTCTITVDLALRYDAQQKAEVERAIGQSFVPFVFGPHARLLEMTSTLVLKCDPLALGVTIGP